MQNDRTAAIVAYVVTAVWALSFLADIALKSYEPSPYIHLAMMAIIGGITGKTLFQRNGKEPD